MDDQQVIEFERSVEAIASRADSIPPEFILSEEDQPASTTFSGPAVPDIPTIDLSLADHAAVIRQVSNAAREWGIFQLVNHGIPIQLIQRLQEAGKRFFELPSEEKALYGKTSAGGIEGYATQLHDSHQVDINNKKMINKGWNDHLFHRVWPPSRINHRFWPENPPFYREVNEEYALELRRVADKLFEMLSLGLGLEGHVLKEAVGGDEQLEYLMKINYYPPCPRPDATLGVTPHTDLSTLTILVPNEVPGLQVFKDGRWISANYIPGALIVHIGDQIEILSNGEYKAVFHRTTVEKERVRMSWPAFLEPPGEWVVGPLPQLVPDGQVPKYRPKKFKDYSFCKLNKLPQ